MQINTRTKTIRLTVVEHRRLKDSESLLRDLSRFESDDLESSALEQTADYLKTLATKLEPDKKTKAVA